MNHGYPSSAARTRRAPDLQRVRLDTEELLQDLDEPAASSDSGWAVGYLDLMLLLLTLFAALLGVVYMDADDSESPSVPSLDWLLPLPLTQAPAALQPEVVLAAYQSRPAPQVAAAAAAIESEPEAEVARSETPVAVTGAIALALDAEKEPDPLLLFDPHELARLVAGMRDERLGVEVRNQQVWVEMQDEILFPLGSADLAPAGMSVLDRLAQGLAAKDVSIQVEGHTDDLPIATTRFPSNWELSSFRATTVARYLIGRGVDPAMLQVSGYADTRPRVPNDTPENRTRNRRVTLVLQRRSEPPPEPAMPEPDRWTAL